MDVAHEAEQAFALAANARVVKPDVHRRAYWLQRNRIARYWTLLKPNRVPDPFLGVGRNLLFFLMWFDKRIFPTLRNSRRKTWLYVFDCWEPHWDELVNEMNSWRNMGAIFFASSQAATYFETKVSFPVRWCPQATTPIETIYSNAGSRKASQSDSEKRKTVMNIGRPNTVLTKFFRDFCNRHDMHFISQEAMEQPLFDSRAKFFDAILESDIVVVHPRNMEQPQITGRVSMLTARYLEAYQSGGVVCGFKPTSGEFEKVLGDLPFVEYENDRQFEDELIDALDCPEKWLVARDNVERYHTWRSRASYVLAEISSMSTFSDVR